jgi:hypothetical protein
MLAPPQHEPIRFQRHSLHAARRAWLAAIREMARAIPRRVLARRETAAAARNGFAPAAVLHHAAHCTK